MMIGLQRPFKRMAACELLPWPACGWPSNKFTHPAPSKKAKTPKPTPFEVYDLSSLGSILVNNINASNIQAWMFGRPLLWIEVLWGAAPGRGPGQVLGGFLETWEVVAPARPQGQPAPSRSRGSGAAHHRGWAAYML